MISNKLKSVFGVIIGTVLEWYDFTLLGTMAPIFSVVFFPAKTPVFSLLATYGAFAAGFLARPLGGMLFGHIGDSVGRKSALSLTISMMALPTTLIGLMPSFHTIGILAPIFLIILRIIQGAAASGEYPGAICILTEMAPADRRGLWGSLSMFGVVGGILFGSLVNLIISRCLITEQIYAWGWRIPFLLGLPLGLIGWYLRSILPESDMFRSEKFLGNISKYPLTQVFRNNFPALCRVTLFFALGNISFYMGFVYIGAWLVSSMKSNFHETMISTSISTIFMMIMIPIFGYLSDRINRKHVMFAGALCLLIFFYPIFRWFCIGGNLILGQMLLALFVAMFVGPMAAISAEEFQTSLRYSGISIGLNIGSTFFGGTCPLVAVWLVHYFNNELVPGIYPPMIAFVCVLVLGLYKKDVNFQSVNKLRLAKQIV